MHNAVISEVCHMLSYTRLDKIIPYLPADRLTDAFPARSCRTWRLDRVDGARDDGQELRANNPGVDGLTYAGNLRLFRALLLS